jgi:hypothetical protein
VEKLVQMTDSLIENIEKRSPKAESTEWYLLNHLRHFREISSGSPSRHEFENGLQVLSRFCVDSMDWDDPLFKAATAITEQARHAIPS